MSPSPNETVATTMPLGSGASDGLSAEGIEKLAVASVKPEKAAGPASGPIAQQPGGSLKRRKRNWRIAILGPAVLLPIWLAPWGKWGIQLPVTFRGALVTTLLIVVTLTDLRWRRIPNWATYSAVLWGLALSLIDWLLQPSGAADQLGAVGLLDSLTGGGVLFVASVVLFSLTGGGAGDVKLLAALGVLLGLEPAIDVVLYGFVAAGAASLAWAIWTFGARSICGAVGRQVGNLMLPGRIDRPSGDQRRLLRSAVPLAPFFAFGTLLVSFGLPLAQLSRLLRF